MFSFGGIHRIVCPFGKRQYDDQGRIKNITSYCSFPDRHERKGILCFLKQ
ncbi:hypothetical protein M7I_5344 [Glarea lozoyensis 74030]|uniref:Uncharacterized protein n=1 Tax=Glarea lozoyensis (strain ATCC 74030 / MF5533) TaxID=1104152 RepID=H0ERM4_GLAL7|nr:hypothetical protein M7I_5344 [Glarea lozoyensis 74030]